MKIAILGLLLQVTAYITFFIIDWRLACGMFCFHYAVNLEQQWKRKR